MNLRNNVTNTMLRYLLRCYKRNNVTFYIYRMLRCYANSDNNALTNLFLKANKNYLKSRRRFDFSASSSCRKIRIRRKRGGFGGGAPHPKVKKGNARKRKEREDFAAAIALASAKPYFCARYKSAKDTFRANF